MTDNVAVVEGYTEEVFADTNDGPRHFLVKPGTDLGERFRAWDMDLQQFSMVYGWLAVMNYC